MYGLVVVGVIVWLIIRARRHQPPVSSDRWRRRYEKVLRSARWRRLRDDMYRRQRGRCGWCGWPFGTARRELHHLPGSYQRLGRERPRDVLLVHVPCHHAADAARREVERLSRRRGRRPARRSTRTRRR